MQHDESERESGHLGEPPHTGSVSWAAEGRPVRRDTHQQRRVKQTIYGIQRHHGERKTKRENNLNINQRKYIVTKLPKPPGTNQTRPREDEARSADGEGQKGTMNLHTQYGTRSQYTTPYWG